MVLNIYLSKIYTYVVCAAQYFCGSTLLHKLIANLIFVHMGMSIKCSIIRYTPNILEIQKILRTHNHSCQYPTIRYDKQEN